MVATQGFCSGPGACIRGKAERAHWLAKREDRCGGMPMPELRLTGHRGLYHMRPHCRCPVRRPLPGIL